MATQQIFTTRLGPGDALFTSYVGPMLAPTYWSTAPPAGVPWQTAGTFKNVTFTHLTAPGSGNSFIYTFVLNGIDTALTITIAGTATTGSDLTHVVTVAPGDVVYWKRVPVSNPTLSDAYASGEFWGFVDHESGYGALFSWNNTQTWRGSLFNQGQWNTGNGGVINFEVVGAAGDVTSLSYALATAPGSGKSHEVSVYKNGTKQDGAGGTPDTRVTISGTATTGSWSGTLTFAAGDYAYLEVAPSGSPASTEIGAGVKFVATTDGESQGGGQVFFNLPTSGGPHYASPSEWSSVWDTTETDVDAIHEGVTAFDVRALRIRMGTSVNTGPITFSFRQNGSTTALAATLTTGQTAGSDLVDSVTISPTDTWSMQFSQAGTPGVARIAGFGFAMYAPYTPDPSKRGSAVFGVNTTVTATRAVAFGLDGATNVHADPGVLKVFGDLDVTGDLDGTLPLDLSTDLDGLGT